MGLLKNFTARHPHLFEHQTSTEIHPHDHLMAITLLRLFPKTVTPNKVTLFRVIFTPLAFALVLYDLYAPGICVFLILALTDAIDGSLARTRGQVTNFGKVFDPLADKFLIGSMVLVLVFKNYPYWLGLAVLGVEIVVIMVATFNRFKFKTIRGANVWGKIKMHLQVIAVFLTLAGLLWQYPTFFSAAAWLFGLSFGFAFVSLFAGGL